MEQKERLDYLISYLQKEQKEYQSIVIPTNIEEKKRLLRSLMNMRPPTSIREQFLRIQDEYLQQELSYHTIVSLEHLNPAKDNIYLWKGDITKLKVDAIVNAGNSTLLGCFVPCHGCIDNAIHSFAGIELRLACQRIMEHQQTPEPAGKAKITKGYNLPAKYVLHTVGPIVHGRVTKENQDMLKSCYLSCLELAEQYHLKSIAFCCISTGEFHFPNELAGKIAVDTVTEYLGQSQSKIGVIFNVFKDKDLEIYQRLLAVN